MLTILGRAGQRYIRLRATKTSMRDIRKFVRDVGGDVFEDAYEWPNQKNFGDFAQWRDELLVVAVPAKVSFDVICGYNVIHIIVSRCADWEWFNEVLDRHAVWLKPKAKAPWRA